MIALPLDLVRIEKFSEMTGYTPSAVRGYESATKVHLLPAFGPLPIDELSTQTIRPWGGRRIFWQGKSPEMVTKW